MPSPRRKAKAMEGFINDPRILSFRPRTVPFSRRDLNLDPPTQPGGFFYDGH